MSCFMPQAQVQSDKDERRRRSLSIKSEDTDTGDVLSLLLLSWNSSISPLSRLGSAEKTQHIGGDKGIEKGVKFRNEEDLAGTRVRRAEFYPNWRTSSCFCYICSVTQIQATFHQKSNRYFVDQKFHREKGHICLRLSKWGSLNNKKKIQTDTNKKGKMLGSTNTVDTVRMSHGKLYRCVNLQNIRFNFEI